MPEGAVVPEVTGPMFGDGGGVMTIGGVAAGGANVVGAAGPEAGDTGADGVTGSGVGARVIVMGSGRRGASAEILLVRSLTFESRAFSACVVCACRPPAAGSMSSAQAPHWCTEST